MKNITFTLWRVAGLQEDSDGGVGAGVWLYLTDGSLPDTTKPFEGYLYIERSWLRVDKIERLGSLPAVFHPGSQFASLIQQCVEKGTELLQLPSVVQQCVEKEAGVL
jgi:hypothetical protein